MFVLKLMLKLLVLPLIVVITLLQWIGIFLVSMSAWIFNLIASLLFILALISVIGGAGIVQVIPLIIMAFVVFVVPFVGEWMIERIIDVNFFLRELF